MSLGFKGIVSMPDFIPFTSAVAVIPVLKLCQLYIDCYPSAYHSAVLSTSTKPCLFRSLLSSSKRGQGSEPLTTRYFNVAVTRHKPACCCLAKKQDHIFVEQYHFGLLNICSHKYWGCGLSRGMVVPLM